MVPTDTLDRGGYMGGRCVALTWSSEIDGRPDWPSDHMPAPWPGVWFECSSLSTHCSKVRGSTSVGTGFPHSFTRPPVRTHRGRHPARSGRPRGARRKVAWFRTFTYVLGRSETSPGHLIIGTQSGSLCTSEPRGAVRGLCRSPCDAHTPQVHARSRFVVRARFSPRAAGRPRGGKAEVSLLRDRGWERPFSTKKDHSSTPKPPPLQPPSAVKSNGHLSVPDIHRVRTAANPRKPAAEAEFYEIDFPLTNPETHNIGT